MDEIERLMREATPLPWYVDTSPNASPDYVSADGRAIARCYGSPNLSRPLPARTNAALIVAAVNALPELLALREEVGRLRAVLTKIANFEGYDCTGVASNAELEIIDEARAALNQEPTP